MDEDMNASEVIERVVRDKTILQIILLAQKCESLEELIAKLNAMVD